MKRLTNIFKALSDANRVRIEKMLEVKPMYVCKITAVLGLAPSTISKHLSVLRKAGFIFEQKEGKCVYYHMKRATVRPDVHTMLENMRRWLNDDDVIGRDREAASRVSRQDICDT